MTNNDGGPAFPRPMVPGNSAVFDTGAAGMSLRDWFAGQALAALISTSNPHVTKSAAEARCEDHSRWAYEYADAMLKARASDDV